MADSRFHIVGEAASAHHAWIVGALDSALRGVWMFLERFRLYDMQTHLVEETMPYQSPTGEGMGKGGEVMQVPRFGRTGEIDYKTAHLQVALGMLEAGVLPVDRAAA